MKNKRVCPQCEAIEIANRIGNTNAETTKCEKMARREENCHTSSFYGLIAIGCRTQFVYTMPNTTPSFITFCTSCMTSATCTCISCSLSFEGPPLPLWTFFHFTLRPLRKSLHRFGSTASWHLFTHMPRCAPSLHLSAAQLSARLSLRFAYLQSLYHQSPRLLGKSGEKWKEGRMHVGMANR